MDINDLELMTKENTFYKPFEKFILRTPFLSLNYIENLTEDVIKDLCRKEIIAESIYIASPELYREMLKFIAPDSKNIDRNLLNALAKYLIRMGSRSTPFGLFSGCSIGKLSNTNSVVEIDYEFDHKRNTRIDMNYLCSLVQQIENDIEIRKKLLYFPNNSLYKVGEELRYVEYKYENFRRNHYIISVDNSEYLDVILSFSKEGKSIKSLSELIVNDEISSIEAEDFINELINNQILTSNLMPNVSGVDYFEKIKGVLNTFDNDYNIILTEICDRLLQLNQKMININEYIDFNKLLLSINNKGNEKFLIQKDLYLKTKCSIIKYDITDSLYNGVKVLNKLTRFNESKNLLDFKKNFLERYETEEIPLCLALDSEVGIGYGNIKNNNLISPLIDDLPIYQNYENENAKYTFDKIEEFIYLKYIQNLKNNESLIEITDDELENFNENWTDLPDTFSVMTNILSSKEDNTLLHLEFAGGSSASRLIGRFSYLDIEMHNFINEIYKKESELNNDVIIAEIIHLPESRTGNITHRYSTREFEIEYLAKSELVESKKININDLFISIKNNKIILRSGKLNKIIKPILSNAHNYSYNSLPIYNFLCDIQSQGLRRSLLFKWPDLLLGSNFLPRVKYKNIILSLAEWNLDIKEINDVNDIIQFRSYLVQKKVPKKVLISESDNELLINIDNDIELNIIRNILKSKNKIKIKEFLYDDNSLVKSKTQKFTNEIIFTFYKNF